MALPSPSQLEVEVKEIREGLSRLLDGYKWAHSAIGVRTPQRESTDPELDSGNVMPARGDVAFSDPVGDAVATQTRMLSNMRQATTAVLRIRRQVEFALEAVGRIFTDREERYDLRPGGDPGVLVTRADLVDAHQAKARRQSRGEDWGEG